ncbi:MAG: amidohydrolase family protein [Colwellia sp.]|nr:amidohydrolase family protein [Colwellia sp.]
MKIIDPHIHLFNIEQGDYNWLKPDNPPFWLNKSLINKTFNENELTLNAPLQLISFVHIEAGFDNNKPWRELAMLDQSCKKSFRAIATVDLTISSQCFNNTIEKLLLLPSFIGVRHILGEQGLSLLTNAQVLKNFKSLNNLSSFAKEQNKKLIFETQLPLTENEPINTLCNVISDTQNISFIINHAGFPPADRQSIEWQYWQSNLVKLSKFDHVVIKCSGWEMTDRNYQHTWLNESMSFILKTFDCDKVMLASNFPLCLFSKSSYQDYWQSLIDSEFFQDLNNQEKSALCYDNALKWYSILA